MTIQRLENVGIVVDDLAAATTFFVELGLKVLGEGPVEGGWVDRVVGLEGVRVDIAMLETSDGHGRLELMKFHAPPARGGDRNAPANTLGIRRVAFAVDDIDAAVAGVASPRRGAPWWGGALPRQVPALLRPRPGGDHRHACGADWLRGPGADRLAIAWSAAHPRAQHTYVAKRGGRFGELAGVGVRKLIATALKT
jgi:catechol 2,3-dioxygenase-like lactoylglutathione lyase family enzyme